MVHVRSASLLQDGSIAILSAGTYEIRLFDADGDLLQTVGRQGQGPGEFMEPLGARFSRDGGGVVVDAVNQRMTTFDTQWKVEREERIPYPIGPRATLDSGGPPLEGGVIAIPSLGMSVREVARRAEGVYEDSLVIEVVYEGRRQVTLRRLRGRSFQSRVDGGGIVKVIPFGEEALYVWAGDRIVLGTSHSLDFAAFDPSGKTIGRYRLQGQLREPTSTDWALYQARLRQEFAGTRTVAGVLIDRPTQAERFLSEAPRGDWLPLFDALHIDRAARLWAREYGALGEVAWWQVATVPEGVVARVPLPSGAVLLDAGDDYVLVLERDELGVEMVRMYGLAN